MELIELVKVSIPPTIAIFGILVKGYIDNRGIMRKMESIDKTQNEKLDKLQASDTDNSKKIDSLLESDKKNIDDIKTLQKAVNEMVEIHKYKPFLASLNTKVMKRIISYTKGINKEVSQMILNAYESTKPYFMEIVESDFQNIDCESILEILKLKAKNVRTSINPDNLDIAPEKYNGFISEIKLKLVTSMKIFSQSLAEISQ